jgi:MerR family transcriptional regulator, copper efflux regulator
MLRYRESLGLLPEIREHQSRPRTGAPLAPPGQHRRFDERDLEAVALGLAIERRYDVSPAALAFGLRVLAEPGVRAEVAELARRIGRIRPPAARALDFEQERAQRLLGMPADRGSAPRPS